MAIAVAVRVRFFARLREQAGVEIEPRQMSPGSTLADVYDVSRRAHAALPEREGVRAALNQEVADSTIKVSDGDAVAFIPPVSVGAHRSGILFVLTADARDGRRLERAVP